MLFNKALVGINITQITLFFVVVDVSSPDSNILCLVLLICIWVKEKKTKDIIYYILILILSLLCS